MPTRPFVLRSLGLSVALVMLPTFLSAQTPAETEFPKVNAVLKEPIKSVRSIRELRDGRLLVVDGSPQRLVLADFTSGKVETRMKTGTEDDEARSLGPLWVWPGDSTVSLDAGRARVMVFGPDGALGRVANLGASSSAAPPPGARVPRVPTLRYLVGTDAAIGIGISPRPAAPPTPASPPPRVLYPVVRFSLRTLRFDTIAQLLPPQSPRAPSSPNGWGSGTYTVFVGTAPLQSVDVWTALADGTVAIVRAASYRIEWVAPDGTRSFTEPVPFTPITVTSGDKKRVSEEFKRTSDEALQANSMRTAALAINYDEPASWPATHPPFRGDLVPLVDLRDRLWLATRCMKDEQSLCYDVIDRTGARVERYRLPPKTSIVGFGKDAAYSFLESKGIVQRHGLAGPP
ncbi:MAG: hypothetical protein ABMA00_06915 [Gemmatimonas sp.]